MYGKYQHTLDAKGRLFVPSKLKEELGAAFYIAKAPDACLTVYPEAEWQKVLDHCNELPASKARAMRFFFANVAKCEPDKQGRFLIPANLRQHAKLGKEAVLIGVSNRIEVWSKEEWTRYNEDINPSVSELAETLADLGI